MPPKPRSQVKQSKCVVCGRQSRNCDCPEDSRVCRVCKSHNCICQETCAEHNLPFSQCLCCKNCRKEDCQCSCPNCQEQWSLCQCCSQCRQPECECCIQCEKPQVACQCSPCQNCGEKPSACSCSQCSICSQTSCDCSLSLNRHQIILKSSLVKDTHTMSV